jgi:DNA (cytosine-5)-methyltransferase 1
MVWENVPGSLSSGKPKGADFQIVLTEIVKIVKADTIDVPLPKDGRWPKSGILCGVGDDGQPFSVAYKVHDAQYWGVPQRRKRLALLADFNGLTAGELLFDPQYWRETESAESDSPE